MTTIALTRQERQTIALKPSDSSYTTESAERGFLDEHAQSIQPVKSHSESRKQTYYGKKNIGEPNKLDYEKTVWVLTLILIGVAIAERFTTNAWHAFEYTNPFGLFYWSADIYILISMIIGRTLVVSSGVVILLQCKTLMNWFYEHRPRWLSIKGDLKSINDRLHANIATWLLGVPVVIHVWTIFLPFLSKCDFRFHASWHLPHGVGLFDKVSDLQGVQMNWTIHTLDELLSTTLVFCAFIPYSMMKVFQEPNFSFCMWLHIVGALWYCFELVAPETNIHAWSFNVPIIFLFICDRLYGIWFYRRFEAVIVRKVVLGKDYMVLYTRIKLNESKYDYTRFRANALSIQKIQRRDAKKSHIETNLADVYYLNSISTRLGERAHPFTSFSNHSRKEQLVTVSHTHPSWGGHKFQVQPSRKVLPDLGPLGDDDSNDLMIRQETPSPHDDSEDDTKELTKESTRGLGLDEEDVFIHDWNVAFIIKVHDLKETSRRSPWTFKLACLTNKYLGSLRAWGPYRSEYQDLKELIHRSHQPEIVLSASGSGVGYILDFYYYLTRDGLSCARKKLRNKVHVFFSCRSLELFQFFTNITCKHHIANWIVNAHLTRHDHIKHLPRATTAKQKARRSRIGRLFLPQILKDCADVKRTHVFFCGSPNMQAKIKEICYRQESIFHEGHTFRT